MRSRIVLLLAILSLGGFERRGRTAAAIELERISLREAIQRALTRHPNVEVQLAEVQRAQAQLEQARGASLPTLFGNGIYTRIDHDRVLSSPMGDTILSQANAVTLNLTAALPVFAPRAWVRWAQSAQNVRVVEKSVAAVRRQVAMAAASAYLAIIERRREVELNRRARDTAKAHFDYTYARLRGGRGSRLDAVRAEQELATDEAQLAAAELGVVRAQEALGVLVASDRPVDIAEEPWLSALDPAQAAEQAPYRRADLLYRQAATKLARRILHDDWSAYMPSLNLSFSPIYTYPGTIFVPPFSWQAVLTLSVPFYDGGTREGVRHEHQALVAAASAAQLSAERLAQSEVRVGTEAVSRASAAIERAQRAAQLAHEALKIAELSYQAGATTNIELIDAQRRARDADTAAAVLEDAARQARIDLMFAAGEL